MCTLPLELGIYFQAICTDSANITIKEHPRPLKCHACVNHTTPSHGYIISMLEILRASSPAEGVLFQFIKPQFINNPVKINDFKTLLFTHFVHSMYVQLDQFYQFRPHGRDT